MQEKHSHFITMKEQIKAYFEREKEAISNLNYDEITEAVEVIKDAYEREMLDSLSFCEVIVCARANEEGFFVEYNPHTAGIMDVCGNISFIPGTHVLVEIKNDTEKGFRSRFLARI